MIIYHTTFHLSDEIYLKGLDYLRTVYIPSATRSEILHSPKMQRVLDKEGDGNGVSLSIQFYVENEEMLEDWMYKEGGKLQKEMMEKFQDQMAGFTTLLEVIEF